MIKADTYISIIYAILTVFLGSVLTIFTQENLSGHKKRGLVLLTVFFTFILVSSLSIICFYDKFILYALKFPESLEKYKMFFSNFDNSEPDDIYCFWVYEYYCVAEGFSYICVLFASREFKDDKGQLIDTNWERLLLIALFVGAIFACYGIWLTGILRDLSLTEDAVCLYSSLFMLAPACLIEPCLIYQVYKYLNGY